MGDKIVYAQCFVCNKDITIKNFNGAKKRFCSNDCRIAEQRSRSNKVTITCLHCNKEKEVKKCYVERGQYKFCSQECAIAYKVSDKTVKHCNEYRTCPQCGKSFFDDSKKQIHCSVVCQGKAHSIWVKENQSGENNAFYGKTHSLATRLKQSSVRKTLFKEGKLIHPMLGKGKGRKYPPRSADIFWRELRKSILFRDNNKCLWCDSVDRLEVHHIVPFVKTQDHSFDNLITLCRNCHKKVYKKEERFADAFCSLLEMQYKGYI